MGKKFGLVSLLVLSFMVLLMPLAVYGDDMLIVKDAGGVNTVFKVDDTGKVAAGQVGVNTTSPAYQIEVAAEGAVNSAIGIRSANTTTAGVPVFFGLRGGGTLASPAPTPSGSGLFWLGGVGWRPSTGWNSPLSGLMGFNAAQTFSDTGMGTYFFISTTPIGSTARAERLRITDAGRVGIGTTTPSRLFSVGTNGAGSDGSSWFTSSSREYKENIQELSAEKAIEAVKSMTPVTFVYKNIPGYNHVGFIAEDVPDLVATPDRKSLSTMDIVAVLTKVVQEQQKTIADLKEEMAKLKKTVSSE